MAVGQVVGALDGVPLNDTMTSFDLQPRPLGRAARLHRDDQGAGRGGEVVLAACRAGVTGPTVTPMYAELSTGLRVGRRWPRRPPCLPTANWPTAA